jgi:methyl-accepting chemotaxis protein
MDRKQVMRGLFAATVPLALLAAGAGAAGVRALRRAGGGDGELYSRGVHAVGAAGNLGRTFQSTRSAMRDMIMETDPAENLGYEAALDEGRATLLRSIDELKRLVRGNAAHEGLVDDVDICMKDYFVVTDDMMILAMANRNAEAAALMRNEAVPANQAFAAALTALMDAVDAQAKEQAQANDRAVALGGRLATLGAASALLLVLTGTATVLLATVLTPRPADPAGPERPGAVQGGPPH